jgi:phosphoenolpyruvate-protein kinase (PTS system EI component)
VPLIPAIKSAVREMNLADCRIIAEQVSNLESADDVREALQRFHEAKVDASPVMEN